MTHGTCGRWGAAPRPPNDGGYWLQVSLEVWLFIVPMVEHVHVINWVIPHAQEAKTLGAYPLGYEAAGHEGHMNHH